jgi:hypothetical protein
MNHLIFKYKLINCLINNKLNCLILFNYNYIFYLDQHIKNLMDHTH